MSASAQVPQKRDQFTIPIKCICGLTGSAVWEENSSITVFGPEASLVSLSDDFYERMKKKDLSIIEIVCRKCGAVQEA